MDGPVASAMRKAKYEYKLLLKRKSYQAQTCFSNKLHDALINKEFTQFWRSWNAKFGNRPQAQVINGCSDHGSIAEAFSEHALCIRPTLDLILMPSLQLMSS